MFKAINKMIKTFIIAKMTDVVLSNLGRQSFMIYTSNLRYDELNRYHVSKQFQSYQIN